MGRTLSRPQTYKSEVILGYCPRVRTYTIHNPRQHSVLEFLLQKFEFQKSSTLFRSFKYKSFELIYNAPEFHLSFELHDSNLMFEKNKDDEQVGLCPFQMKKNKDNFFYNWKLAIFNYISNGNGTLKSRPRSIQHAPFLVWAMGLYVGSFSWPIRHRIQVIYKNTQEMGGLELLTPLSPWEKLQGQNI